MFRAMTPQETSLTAVALGNVAVEKAVVNVATPPTMVVALENGT
jgi:hypothetical protein